jgi:hypothetical protein
LIDGGDSLQDPFAWPTPQPGEKVPSYGPSARVESSLPSLSFSSPKRLLSENQIHTQSPLETSLDLSKISPRSSWLRVYLLKNIAFFGNVPPSFAKNKRGDYV